LSRWLAVFSVIAAFALVAGPANAVTCTATGFKRDNINLTAALIAPPGETDYASVTVDATGCNVGIYFGPGTSGSVDSSEVFGANYFGILVAGDNDELPGTGAASVDVTNNAVHDIGENPFNGTQHGV
jgi:ethanolamine utilization microcompartment shell protein EutL